jgi:hypothetical protein
VTSGSDWRDNLTFETPFALADVAPGEPTRCFVCGPASAAVDRDDLWVVKHRHPKQHSGYVRFYCAEHVPAAPRVAEAPAAPAAKRASAPRAPRTPSAPKAPRPTPAADRVRPICPDCFVEVPPTGICGSCGARIA